MTPNGANRKSKKRAVTDESLRHTFLSFYHLLFVVTWLKWKNRHKGSKWMSRSTKCSGDRFLYLPIRCHITMTAHTLSSDILVSIGRVMYCQIFTDICMKVIFTQGDLWLSFRRRPVLAEVPCSWLEIDSIVNSKKGWHALYRWILV